MNEILQKLSFEFLLSAFFGVSVALLLVFSNQLICKINKKFPLSNRTVYAMKYGAKPPAFSINESLKILVIAVFVVVSALPICTGFLMLGLSDSRLAIYVVIYIIAAISSYLSATWKR